MIQSNYLPWRGYFDFIDDVDLFILYDDVQYTRRDWRNRNRIRLPDGPVWLTVPVTFSRSAPTLIKETEICYQNDWIREHVRSLTSAYRRAPYFERYAPSLFEILSMRHKTISELNCALIHRISEALDIHTPIRMSHDYEGRGIKTDRIIDILKKTKATHYLVGPAAKDYIEEGKFEDQGITLEYKSYDYPEYPQMHGRFEPNLSIVDLLFNCGPESREYLKSRIPNRTAAAA